MSEGMIIRRGGGGGGFDPTGAILKVVTSAGCTVNVSGTSYSRTQTDAEGFPRSGDANVVEHFFNIPSTAFGTITVTATNTYGTNTKTLTVNTAGKVYEQLCGGLNIILDSVFGLQSGFSFRSPNIFSYSDRYKYISVYDSLSTNTQLFNEDVSVSQYTTLTTIMSKPSATGVCNMKLIDIDNTPLVIIEYGLGESGTEKTGQLVDKYYPTAKIYVSGGITHIDKIVLS